MHISPSQLMRATGLFAAASGLLYIIIQPIHPEENSTTVTGYTWALVGYMTIAMALFGLVGVTGIYLRQIAATGLLGLIGFVLFGCFFLLTIAFNFAETLIMPPLAGVAPEFVNGFEGIFSGVATPVDLGALPAVNPIAAVLYVLGGLLFGFAVYRARILDRWAALLLIIGAALTPLFGLLPHSIARWAAIPVGLAMMGLGYSLWSVESRAVTTPDTPPQAGLTTAT